MSIDPRQASVVIVEDNHHNLFIGEILLIEDVGVRYYQGVQSGKQLFEVITSHPSLKLDLVLLDIQLPGDDGYAVCQQMRLNPRFKDTKVVAMTANVMPQDVERARVTGFNGFIGKPINRYRFPDQIRRILADEEVWEPK